MSQRPSQLPQRGLPKGARKRDDPARREARPRGTAKGETERQSRAGKRTLDPELIAELAAVATAAGCELAHAELKGNTLRLFIDRVEGDGAVEGGVTLGDCEHVARQASALLDVADFGTGRYVLEVSSPGLDRQLHGPRDYARFSGRLARVTFAPPGGSKRTVVARLGELREAGEGGGRAEIDLVDDRTGEVLAIGLDDIAMARLEVELG